MPDARKHDTPEALEAPRRTAILDLSLSVNDIVPVANVIEQAQVVADLVDAGVAPTPALPLFTTRADGPDLEVYDGTTWRIVGAPVIFESSAPPGGTTTASALALEVSIPAEAYRRRLMCHGNLYASFTSGTWDAALSVNQSSVLSAQRFARFTSGGDSKTMTYSYDLAPDTIGTVRLWYRLVTGSGTLTATSSAGLTNLVVEAWRI